MTLNDHLRRVITLHFDSRWGSRYWIEHANSLNFNPITDISSVEELSRFGPMELSALAARPVEDFIPRAFHDRLHEFITSETGGTTGLPKRTAYRQDEFHAAFVQPFLEAATLMQFPRNRHWLFVGPSGPHVIGKASRACAKALGSIDPFTVDFDPRWSRRLPNNSFAKQRYVEHVLDQAFQILRTQSIGVIFSTPPVLTALAARLSEDERRTIGGIHVGGMAAPPEFWDALTRDWFPNATILSGYGNSLAGVCPQLWNTPGEVPTYFAHGLRLALDVVPQGEPNAGHVVFHRMDESSFLPNVIERDVAALSALPEAFRGSDFQRFGLHDPHPRPEDASSANAGLY